VSRSRNRKAEQHTSKLLFLLSAISHKKAHKAQNDLLLNEKLFCALCAFLWLDFFRGLTDFHCAALDDFRVNAAQAERFPHF
jgi:hypothetical protein